MARTKTPYNVPVSPLYLPMKRFRQRTPNYVRRFVYAASVFASAVSLYLVLSLAFGSPASPSNGAPIVPRAGNPILAGDLYGIGVRVGFYLQAMGMILSTVTLEVGAVKIACAANSIGLLTSWTYLTSKSSLSPSEAWLILSLVGINVIVGSPLTTIPDPSGFVGIILLILALVWTMVSTMWFWTTLYAQLQAWDTPENAWFFTKVSITGWYRIFMLVLTTLQLIATVPSVGYSAIAAGASFGYAIDGRKSSNDIYNDFAGSRDQVRGSTAFTAVYMIFFIADIEMTIIYNELEPEMAFASAGQIIPFVTGIVVMLDGIFGLFVWAISDDD